jgi:hypothetical protein
MPKHLGKLIPPPFRVVDHIVLIYGFCSGCDRVRNVRSATTRRKGTSAINSVVAEVIEDHISPADLNRKLWQMR